MPDLPQKPLIAAVTSSPAWKLGIIGFIILVLMIPVAWISSLIHERYNRSDSVAHEIAVKWGAAQTVSGPFLSVPYYIKVLHKDSNGKDSNYTSIRYLHITPETMTIDGKVESILHHRGIFKVPGYTADLYITCSLPASIDIENKMDNYSPDWSNAIVSFDLKDERGLKELTGELNGQPLKFNKSSDVLTVTANPEPAQEKRGFFDFTPREVPETDLNFKFGAGTTQSAYPSGAKLKLHVKLTGTRKLSFLASALKEKVGLLGDWRSPSFTGDILPDSRTITQKGFVAAWQTNYLNTGNKPSWSSEEPTIRLSSLGINFLIMVDSYQQTTRTLKYCILFLLLTFMTFFFAETMTKQRIHPIQYLMVGCSLIIFYLLLLSISEHLAFVWAYLIAAFGVVLQISLYCYTILKTRKFALQVGAILAGLYAFLYALLQLEDSALLVGSISLFVLLGVAMYVIRNVKWYNQE
jgi:inner membrane protein